MNPIPQKTRRCGRLGTSLVLWLGIGLAPAVLGVDMAPVVAATNRVFSLAFTSTMFSEVNENDARAAMKVWILAVAQARNIPVDPEPRVYRTAEEMAEACRAQPVDGFGLVTEEYARLGRTMKFDRFAVGVRAGRITEEYIVLVRKDSGWQRLEQLKGGKLNVLHTPRTSLALIWLDTVLLEAHLKRTTDFFGSLALVSKPSRAALPVFFGQADACLMTRISYEVMGELNPQLKTQLRILAVSPGLVPNGFAFRSDYVSPIRPVILTEMARLKENPAGQQILTLVQAEQIEDRPVSCLDRSLELLEKHRRLLGEADASRPNPSNVPPDATKGTGQ